jgi:branched-chain amino acid transport system permease protein
MSELLQYIVNGIAVGCLYSVIALGMVMINNVTGVANLAQGDFAMVGALATFGLYKAGLPLPIAAVLATLLVAALGAGYYQVGLRRILRAGYLILIVSTIGMSAILEGAAFVIWGTDTVPFPQFIGGAGIDFAGVHVPSQQVLTVCAIAALTLAVALFFSKTMLGKALYASADNPLAARLVGISPARMGLLAFALGAAISAFGGILVAPTTSVTWNMGALLTIKAFTAVVLGGMTSVWGAVAGGFVLAIAESLATAYFLSSYTQALTFGILVAALVVRSLPFARWRLRIANARR